MVGPLKKILEPIKELQTIRGVQLPIGLEFLQLVVTGPPGAGKSYYIEQIGGWPNEGYLDLTQKGWWRDQSLIYRPREVHLGLPFKGFSEGLTVFDKEWLSQSPPLELEWARLKIPPIKEQFLQTDWRKRYIFEFLIPSPTTIYKQRVERQQQGYFPVDENLSLEMVRQQVSVYREVALYLHRAGVNVYIRKGLDKPPMWIAEKGVASVPSWTLSENQKRPSLQTFAGWRLLFKRHYPTTWLTVDHKPQDINKPVRIAHDGKNFELLIGSISLRFQPEIALGIKKKATHKNWIINTKQGCSTRTINGFIRIKVGETIVIGRQNKEYSSLFEFDDSVGKRHISITNKKGDLILSPLSPERKSSVLRLDDFDYRERLERGRHKALLDIRRMYGGPLIPLSSETALEKIKQVNKLLAGDPLRPLTDEGKPGGLIEFDSDGIPVIVGDLHARVDNLLKILSENCLLDCLKMKKGYLVILGDAVHSEMIGEMDTFEGSMLIMDLIFSLMLKFPESVFYIRGNHDSFSPDINKNGYLQGELFQEALTKQRGLDYVKEMERFYKLLPFIFSGKDFVACHAGPPRVGNELKKKSLININSKPKLIKEVTKNRLQRPNYLAGYSKGDVKKFRKILKVSPGTPFFVGHTPMDPFGSYWLNVGTIKNHHIIYSAHEEGPSVFIRSNDKFMPISFPAEPLTRIINDLK